MQCCNKARIGKKQSEETKQKRSIIIKRMFVEGKIKHRNNMKGCFMAGEKHPNWQGGRTETFFWKRNNKDKVNFHTRNRRYRLKGASGSHTFQQWEDLKEKYDHTCVCCKLQEPYIVLTEDHIMPISRGGTNYIDNIQPLCVSCNSIKYTKILNFIPLFELTKIH